MVWASAHHNFEFVCNALGRILLLLFFSPSEEPAGALLMRTLSGFLSTSQFESVPHLQEHDVQGPPLYHTRKVKKMINIKSTTP
mmetsp:Transcript_9168/g.22519  ORF Transcript_9168/g.22519 Transcript_9168/m.22519 type:complete len:84 (-) Transcript_9168:1331-1582(-)